MTRGLAGGMVLEEKLIDYFISNASPLTLHPINPQRKLSFSVWVCGVGV